MSLSFPSNEANILGRRQLLRITAAVPFLNARLPAQQVTRADARLLAALPPFVDPIRPPVARTAIDVAGGNPDSLTARLTATGHPPIDVARFQSYAAYPAAKFYDVTIGYLDAYPHSELNRLGYSPSRMFAYGGSVPGPLFHLRYGEPVLVRWAAATSSFSRAE